MRREERLTRRKDFAAARSEGRSLSDRLLVLLLRPNQLDVTRFGFSVSKRVGTAVVRNKVKRRLREAVRLAPVVKGWDLVFIARKDVTSADFCSLSESMMGLLSRARLLITSPEESRPSPEAK